MHYHSYYMYAFLWLQVEGNVLRITRTRMEDRDLYICTAENAAGTARGAAIVDVESTSLIHNKNGYIFEKYSLQVKKT